jgi:16S rRNA (guanine(966)-N(2))-methyltransferase RsmD
MRIISGKYKGRVMKMPKGIRPTQAKVRKALFDILGDIKGLSFLELFSGSGAVGIDALSMGAKEVVFVEKDKFCLRVLRGNLTYPPPSTYSILPFDVFKAIEKLSKENHKFDIIFIDPPYYEDAAKKTLQMLCAYDILAPTGFIIAQHFKRENLPDALGVLTLFKRKTYGDTVLSFYTTLSTK